MYLGIEDVKAYQARKENCSSCVLTKSCIHHSSAPTVYVLIGCQPSLQTTLSSGLGEGEVVLHIIKLVGKLCCVNVTLLGSR